MSALIKVDFEEDAVVDKGNKIMDLMDFYAVNIMEYNVGSLKRYVGTVFLHVFLLRFTPINEISIFNSSVRVVHQKREEQDKSQGCDRGGS